MPSTISPAVLLVDDRPENILSLQAILGPLAEETGARLLAANGADQALRHILAEEEAIALILLDVMMPGTSGLETAALIRQRARSDHLPIIFITALDTDRRRVTLGYQYGAVDYITKPVQPEVIVGKARAFLELHKRRGEATLAERRRYADNVQHVREQSLRDETALVETLQRVGTALASELDLERVVQLVTDEATSLTRARFGAFFYNVEGAALKDGRALFTVSGAPREAFVTLQDDMKALGLAFPQQEIARSDDITSDSNYAQMTRVFGSSPSGFPTVRSYLAVPVRSRTGMISGGLFFGHEKAGIFTEREERLLIGISGWAAVAMDNARLYAGERRARESAEGATRAKAEFLATMSHEFRTPLNAILGYAQLLAMGVLGPATTAQHAHLERLQASARHLLQLVDDVLDVAKIDADRLNVRRDILLTGPAVAAAVTLIQPQATAKGVRLIDIRAEERGFRYHGDEHRVRQILVNLLSNAVKFTPSGGEVTIECGSTDEPEPGISVHPAVSENQADSPWVFIRIEDTGPGIRPEILPQLFEPFVQGDGALTREQGGTGLGLAISRRLARLMGGELVARSESGSRTTFTLWLPAAPASEASSGDRIPSYQPQRSTPSRGAATMAESSGAPLDGETHDIVQALGVRLASSTEPIADRYVSALRRDRSFPGAADLPAAQLRDHIAPFIGLLASQLMTIGETRGKAPDLLRDGGQAQRLMAELHGAQRYRLGWSESDIEKETALMLQEVVSALRGAVDLKTTPEFERDTGGTATISHERLGHAVDFCATVALHILEQGTRAAIRSYRFAKAADAP